MATGGRQPKPLFADTGSHLDRFSFERALYMSGYCRVAGVDEVGRGPLAGPVVAACVVLPRQCNVQQFNDSKKLSERRRQELAAEMQKIGADIGIGIVDERQIDTVNILQASLLAMRLAIEQLALQPDYVLVDGRHEVPIVLAQKALIKGDSRSASIGAASIVAKVTRDALMDRYHEEFPVYNFTRHKGYPTAEHRKLIALHGPCRIHRVSFRGVKEYVKKGPSHCA